MIDFLYRSTYSVRVKGLILLLNFVASLQVFPAMSICASRLKVAVQGVRDAASSEDDLKTMANMYSVALENEIRKPGRCAGPLLTCNPFWA